jgi:hypothetical protein
MKKLRGRGLRPRRRKTLLQLRRLKPRKPKKLQLKKLRGIKRL